MPKLIHNITLELFVKASDSLAQAYAAIDALAPVPMRELHEAQWRWHPERARTKIYELPKRGISLWEQTTEGDEGDIVVLQYRFSKQRDTAAFAERLQGLPEEQREALQGEIEEHIDEDGKLILRFSQDALGEGELRLARKGVALVARINLAAFPKNSHTCAQAARSILE